MVNYRVRVWGEWNGGTINIIPWLRLVCENRNENNGGEFQYYVEDSNQNAPTSKRPGGEKILKDF